MFCALLRDSRAETLLKAGYITLLKHFATTACKIDDYWPSIRIVLRNGYPITDAGTWCDYIDLLRFFDKDLRSARYVCPANLRTEHNRYVLLKMEYYRKQKEQERIREAMQYEERYKEEKGRFFGIDLTDGKIHVRVLDSIEQIRQEGEAMHHCVFTNDYHKKTDSLILSATMEGERLETVEVSLSRLTVVQSRGICNTSSPYHKQIVALVQRNMPLIERQMTA
ncbi:PcfJ domain-containing protein [Alistipes finegoldii]|nr:PcfJ domain-containing protein [Alistipes finegoldii]